MPTVDEHYEHHLAGIYAWMMGGAEAAIARGADELSGYGIEEGPGRALDLGAGFGSHAIPLARHGYDVTAVDGSSALLDQLGKLAGDLPIHRVAGELVAEAERAAPGLSLALCMGDTLTHLSNEDEVIVLLGRMTDKLTLGGKAIVTFRDYTAYEPGARPLFCVRGDDARIASCMLEIGDRTVRVHDLLHERKNGGWTLQASSYDKLRLDPARVRERLSAGGCDVAQRTTGSGMIAYVATRRPSRDQ